MRLLQLVPQYKSQTSREEVSLSFSLSEGTSFEEIIIDIHSLLLDYFCIMNPKISFENIIRYFFLSR
jgi:hypothetical protein